MNYHLTHISWDLRPVLMFLVTMMVRVIRTEKGIKPEAVVVYLVPLVIDKVLRTGHLQYFSAGCRFIDS